MALKQVSRTHNGTNTCVIADEIKLKQKKKQCDLCIQQLVGIDQALTFE